MASYYSPVNRKGGNPMTELQLLERLDEMQSGDGSYAGHESRLDDWMNLSPMVLGGKSPQGNHPTVSTCTCGCASQQCTQPTPCGC
jgi:hypothetical protein